MLLAAFARRHAADDFSLVGYRLGRLKGRFFSGESLEKHAGIFVDEDAHLAPSVAASPTTFCAASNMPSATVKLNPDSSKIFCPNSTFVPSMRTTMGTLIDSSRAAASTPVARVSQRRMPPKILIRTAF